VKHEYFLIWKVMAQIRALKYWGFGTLNCWYCIHITDETKGGRQNAGHKLTYMGRSLSYATEHY